MTRLAILAFVLLPAPALAGPCVGNATDAAYFFAAEADGGARVTATLAPGETLCAPGPEDAAGVVSAFPDAGHFEGCSRLAGPEGDRLIAYADFDRCRWASHPVE